MSPLLRSLLSFARRQGRNIGNLYAPRNVGVHHTLYGAGPDQRFFTSWNTPYVRPSTVPTGQLAATAGDQIPGYSYFWNARGLGGANEAANLARGQTQLQFNRMMLEPGTQGVGKVTTSSRFGPVPDPNLPGTRATMVYGPAGQRVVGEVVSAGGPLSAANADEIARLVNRQKALEAGQSATKVGLTAGLAGPGFWGSVWEGLTSDSYTANRIMENQREAGNRLGAFGTYLGMTASLAAPGGAIADAPFRWEAEETANRARSLEAQAARYNAQRPEPVSQEFVRERLGNFSPERYDRARSLRAQADRYSAQSPQLRMRSIIQNLENALEQGRPGPRAVYTPPAVEQRKQPTIPAPIPRVEKEFLPPVPPKPLVPLQVQRLFRPPVSATKPPQTPRLFGGGAMNNFR